MKRFISIFTSLSVIFSLAVLAGAVNSKTVFYLDYGDVVIGSDSVSGYDIFGNSVSDTNDNGYVVTQKSTAALERSVTVSSGVQSVELLDLNISRINDSFSFAVCVLNGAEAEFIISGTNTVVPGLYRAGIDIAPEAKATICGNGTLNVSSPYEAAIGGGNGRPNGTLVIESGTINAIGGIEGYSAGIGGSTSGDGGNITINGGVIFAQGGVYASGIGGGNLTAGGTITINGGTVTAVGGQNGAGIGGGYLGNGGDITINGGSVKAVAGSNAAAIGNGYKCQTEFSGIKNSSNEALSLVTFEPGDFSEITLNDTSFKITAPHPDDTKLYFYLPENASMKITRADGAVDSYSLKDGVFTVSDPYSFAYSRYLNLLIVENMSVVKVAPGYTLNQTDSNTFELFEGSELVEQVNIYLRGDVNGDNRINSSDALIVLKCAVGLIEPDELTAFRADYTSDKKINSFDALMILIKSVES